MPTEKQRQAMEHDNGDLLVSASAGSGKTYVMVNRILRLIIEGKADADRILCVTFTVLAANEMKQKIAAAITEYMKSADESECTRLSKQIELLPTANISTVHAFCKNLLKEFFYEAGVDPSFSVVSDSEREKLIKRAIDRYFDKMYEENDEKLNILLPVFFKKRKDENLKEIIVGIYKKIMSEAEPFAVLERGDFFYTREGTAAIYEEFCRDYAEELRSYARKAEGFARNFSAREEYQNYICHVINGLNHAAEGNNVADISERLTEALPRRPSRLKGDDEAALRTDAEFHDFVDDYLGFRRAKLKEYELNDFESEVRYAEDGLKVYRALRETVKGFAETFAEEKREENCVDFSDFEHLTIKILKNEEIRKEVRSRFKYVFTDEYQDTSGVQEYILNAVSDNNLFMVGDVKQNIYDFRGCNPEIFAEKRKRFERYGDGVVIDLDKNFRSTKAVIDAVNKVFSGSMTKACGNVDYASNQMIFGADYPENEGVAEIRLVKKNSAESRLPDGVYGVVRHLKKMRDGGFFAEGAYVAKLILEVYGKEIYVGKDGKKKKIDFGDIAILLRSANTMGDAYAKELIAAGIPVSADSKNSIANYSEIVFLVDLLKLIACFNQDIPLASVLKSPICGLTDAELYSIRKFTPKGSFVNAYRAYLAEKGATDEPLALKLKDFDEYMSKVRLFASFMPCDELLARIIREKQIDVMLLSSRMGEFKMARVNAFLRAAGAGKQTVEEFLSDIKETLKNLTIAYDDENAVKILSVHGSKGLEYPVVILASACKQYYDKDKGGNLIFDRKTGVALAHYDPSSMIYHKTEYLHYMKKRLLKRSREEEMRILYVALTRARNELYVIGEYSDSVPALKNSHYEGDIYTVRRLLDFFARDDMPVIDAGDVDDRKQAEREVRQVLIGNYDEELAEMIESNLNFRYSDEGKTLSVKRSVTSVAHFDEDDAPAYEKGPLFEDDERKTDNSFSLDAEDLSLLNGGENDSSKAYKSREKREDIGTAYHAFLEKCDFNNSPESEINRLIDGRLLKDEYIELLDRRKLVRIMNMRIFDELKGWNLYREQPFTAYIPAKVVDDGYDGEGEILIQGVIDLLCIKGDEAVIVDYKYTTEENISVLIARYRKQLELYAYAVEKVLKKKVIKACLVNIRSCKTVGVDLKGSQ